MRALILVASCLAAVAGQAATIDKTYTIVIPDYDESGIPVAICKEARRLKQALAEGAGLSLPIKNIGKFKGGKAIYIGTAAAEKAGLMPADMKDFSSVVAEKGGDIYLFGRDLAIHPGKKANTWRQAPIPSIKAMARFMEDYMDMRFLAPGDVGTDVPEIK